MDAKELKETLEQLQISQVMLAKLLGVTPRTVNDWVRGRTTLPSPVAAYLRLMRKSPLGLLKEEIDSVREPGPTMDEGIYGIDFKGEAGEGVGFLVFRDGLIYGADQGRSRYDGRYLGNAETGQVDVYLHAQIPAAQTVFKNGDGPLEFDLVTAVPPRRQTVERHFDTPYGPLDVRFYYLRELND